MLVLVVDEVDEAFANLYSTAVSAQNVLPSLDRRWVAAGVGVGATILGLLIDLTQYENYLYLIGSVFVPLFGVFAVRYFVLHRESDGAWDVSATARGRWWSALPWLAGFVSYQLVNPGAVSWWKGIWPAWTAPSWLSATLVALLVSAGSDARDRIDHPASGRARPIRVGTSSGTLIHSVRSASSDVSNPAASNAARGCVGEAGSRRRSPPSRSRRGPAAARAERAIRRAHVLQTQRTPPGRSTRLISRSTATGSSTLHRTSAHSTESTLASGSGSCSPTPATSVSRWPAALRRAMLSHGGRRLDGDDLGDRRWDVGEVVAGAEADDQQPPEGRARELRCASRRGWCARRPR